MSKMKGLKDSANTISVRSSYFQTEFTASRKSDGSSADEEIGAISKILNSLPVDRKHESRRNVSQGSSSQKVSISVQTGRSIIGQEDSLPKERKRWIRPPGVGQASTSNGQNVIFPTSHVKESSSEDDIRPQTSKRPDSVEYVSAAEIYQNRKDYINEKPMEGSSDQSLPQLNDQMDFPRVISPSSASSITSRPLEWDSGADVGYFQNYGPVSRSDQEFSSTMERIALVQGRTGMLTRSDPEGTSSSKKGNPAITVIGLPTAESTPINSNSLEGSSKDKNSIKSIVGKQKYHPLFPEVIIQQKGNISDSSNECHSPQKDMFDDSTKDSRLKMLSSSLENVNELKSVEGQAATFPRSQSQSNLNCEHDYNSHLQRILNPQSVSSSSVATVITGLPRKPSKCIQTSYLKNNIGVQYSLNGSLVHEQEGKKTQQNEFGTLDSAKLSSGDRVNSFEYLPGHVYENSSKPDAPNFWENTKGVSLQNDVERGVQIIDEFIQGSNANNTLMKKGLLHRLVETLIERDYPEDAELFKTAPQCSTRRSQNREEVTGESSTEVNPRGGSKALSNSTTLSGQSSSVLQSTSESMKSSVKSIPSAAPKSEDMAGSGSSKRIAKQVNKDKTTDLSSESKSDWKEPLTRAEKLYEMKKKGLRKSDDQLLDFMNSERENQIDWIVKEINHLSNLKTLLEKHERLRKNLNRLKTANSKSDASPSKHNFIRPVGFKRRSQYIPSGNKSMENINLKRRQNLRLLKEDREWDSHNYETDAAGKLKRNASTETRKEDLVEGAKSVAYTITFDPDIKPQKSSRPEVRPIIADRQTLEKESRTRVREAFRNPSLQDCLINKRPDIVTRAETRRQTVAELAAIRQVREEQRPTVLAAALNCETASAVVPPVSLVKRVVTQKEMREQTERKYRKTFEVRKKISDQKLKETHKANRLMADLFNKRLQLLTLKGHTNLSNSIDVISTV